MNSTVASPVSLDLLVPARVTNADLRKRILEDPDLMEKGVLGCFLPAIRDEDIAAYWASISFKNPSAAALMQLILASCNIAQRGLGVATSDVAFALLARFGADIAPMIGSSVDRRLEGVTDQKFSETAASCVETAIMLFRPAAIQPVYYRGMDDKARAIIHDMASLAKSDEAKKNACLALIAWLKSPLPAPLAAKRLAKPNAAAAKRKKEEADNVTLVFYEESDKKALFLEAAMLYPRASPRARERLEELCRKCLWGGIKPEVLLQMQSESWIPSALLLACFKAPEHVAARRHFIRSQIRALMSFPLSYIPDNVDDDPDPEVEPRSLMWPFWELEELLAGIDDASKQLILPAMCEAVLARWNLVCSVVKSFLGPVRYNVWIANAGRLYCARIGMILTLGKDTVLPSARAALYRPREYPLALRPVIRFLSPKGFGAPVLVESSMKAVL